MVARGDGDFGDGFDVEGAVGLGEDAEAEALGFVFPAPGGDGFEVGGVGGVGEEGGELENDGGLVGGAVEDADLPIDGAGD